MHEETLKKIIDILQFFDCKEIYLFGSYANSTFSKHSDIDIAVRGLSPDVFFKAYGEIITTIDIDVDIIDLDDNSSFSRYLIDSNELKQIA